MRDSLLIQKYSKRMEKIVALVKLFIFLRDKMGVVITQSRMLMSTAKDNMKTKLGIINKQSGGINSMVTNGLKGLKFQYTKIPKPNTRHIPANNVDLGISLKLRWISLRINLAMKPKIRGISMKATIIGIAMFIIVAIGF